jgi:hypothetical protein
MPRVNRSEICADDEVQVFQLVNRCVRRTFLCGARFCAEWTLFELRRLPCLRHTGSRTGATQMRAAAGPGCAGRSQKR